MSVIEASSAGVRDMADGSLRITVEFEPRHAKEAYALFGTRGTPLAIAALKTGFAAVHEPEKQKGGPLAVLAGRWCNEPEFLRWMANRYMAKTDMLPSEAAEFIRNQCAIPSRAMLDHDENASAIFNEYIRGPYMKHLQARGLA